MMIPPVVRLGYPPNAQEKVEYICLIRTYGWYVVTYQPQRGGFYANYDSVTGRQLPVYPHDILCWMPQDGS